MNKTELIAAVAEKIVPFMVVLFVASTPLCRPSPRP